MNTLPFHKQFQAIRRCSDALRRFPDPPAVLDHLHAPGGDPAGRNSVLVGFVRAAQSDAAHAETASTLLLLALWPGLDAVRGRLSRYYRHEPEALTSEICGRVLSGIRTLDLDRVNWIAATLIRNTERDIRRHLISQRATVPGLPDAPRVASLLGLPDGMDAEVAARVIADRLRACLGDDAALVVAIAIHGDRHHEAARRLGITADAARKRHQRAMRRLRLEFGDFA